jgi:uncharacterized protein (DUF2236 family)
MVFGGGPEAERAVARLNHIHAGVRGEIVDPGVRHATGADRYSALDPELLLWVQATLLVTSVRAYEAWVGPVRAEEKEAFWQEARAVGERLGIRRAMTPDRWVDLVAWFDGQLAPGGPIVVTETARRLAQHIVRPPLPHVPAPLVDLAVLPGLALLPARIRDDYHIAWSPQRAFAARWLARGVRAWVTLMPGAVRAMPQARAAERRASSAAPPCDPAAERR